jgi:hypothetical protein
MMMLAILTAALIMGVLAALGPKLLLHWYTHEAQRLDVPREAADAVITYPLA